MGRVTIRDMPISPSLKTSFVVLKILGLGSKYPTELTVLLLNKVMKSGVLKGSIGSKGHLLLLNGHKGGLDFYIISGGRLGGRTRSGLISKSG